MVGLQEVAVVLYNQALLDVPDLLQLARCCASAWARLQERCSSRGVTPAQMLRCFHISRRMRAPVSQGFLFMHAPPRIRERLGPFQLHAELLEAADRAASARHDGFAGFALFWRKVFESHVGAMTSFVFDSSCYTPVGQCLVNAEFLAIANGSSTQTLLQALMDGSACGSLAVLHPTVPDFLAGRSRVVVISPPKHWLPHVLERTKLGALLRNATYGQSPFPSAKFQEEAASIHPPLHGDNEQLILCLVFLITPVGLELYETVPDLTLHWLLQFDPEDLMTLKMLVSMLPIRELFRHVSWSQFVELAPRHAKLLAEFATSDAPVHTTVEIVTRLMLHGGFEAQQLPTLSQWALASLLRTLLRLPGLGKLDDRQLDYFKKECVLYYDQDVSSWTVRTPLLELIVHHAAHRAEDDPFSFADDYDAIVNVRAVKQRHTAARQSEWHVSCLLAYTLRLRGLPIADVLACLEMPQIALLTFALLDDDASPGRMRLAIDKPAEYIVSAVAALGVDHVRQQLSKPIACIVQRCLELNVRPPISEFFELLQSEDVRQLVVDGTVQLHNAQALDAVVPKLKDPVVREGLVRRVWDMEFVRQHRYRFTQPLLQVVAAHPVLATKVLRLPNELVDEICAAIEAGFVDVEGLGMNDFVVGSSHRGNDDDDNYPLLCWLFGTPHGEDGVANWKRLLVLGLKHKDARELRLSHLKLLAAPPVHAFLVGAPLRDGLVQQFLAIPTALAEALLTQPDLATQPWFPIAECAEWLRQEPTANDAGRTDPVQTACALVLSPPVLATLVPDVCTMQTLFGLPPQLVPRLNDRILDLIARERVLTIDDILNCRPVLELALSNQWLEAAAEQGAVPEFASLLQDGVVQQVLTRLETHCRQPQVAARFFQSMMRLGVHNLTTLRRFADYDTKALICMLEVLELADYDAEAFSRMCCVRRGWFRADMLQLFKNVVLTMRTVAQLEALFPDLDPSSEGDVSTKAVLTTVASLRAADVAFDLGWLLAESDEQPAHAQILAAILRGQLAGPAKYGILKPQHLSPSSDKQAVLALVRFMQDESAAALLSRLWMAQATLEDIAGFGRELSVREDAERFLTRAPARPFQFGGSVPAPAFSAPSHSGRRPAPQFQFGLPSSSTPSTSASTFIPTPSSTSTSSPESRGPHVFNLKFGM